MFLTPRTAGDTAEERCHGTFNRRRTIGVMALIFLAAVSEPAQAQDDAIYGTSAAVAIRQDSLVRVALGAADQQVRLVAIIGIASPGRVWHSLNGMDVPPPAIQYPGTVARLKQVYRQTGAPERELITSLMALQAERREAVAFLAELALGNDLGGEYPIPTQAVAALSRMGAEGAAELQRLHASEMAPALIRGQLDRLALTGYRRPPGA